MLLAVLRFLWAQFQVFIEQHLKKHKIEGEAKDALAKARRRRTMRKRDMRSARDKFLDRIRNIGGV